MMRDVEGIDKLLPVRIESANFEDPTLTLSGDDWALSVTCEWRWVSHDGNVTAPSSFGFEDQVWNLVGEEVVSVRWAGPGSLGLDPSLEFRSGGVLDVFSDAAFDTWVMHIPGLVLVGPLRD